MLFGTIAKLKYIDKERVAFSPFIVMIAYDGKIISYKARMSYF